MGAKNIRFGMPKKRNFQLHPDLRPCASLIISLLFWVDFCIFFEMGKKKSSWKEGF